MNHAMFIFETIRLEMAVVDGLTAIGCIHEYEDHLGHVRAEVPPDAAHFDPDSGLLWVELSTQRFPRHRSWHSLDQSRLRSCIADRLGHPVEVCESTQKIIFMWRMELAPDQADAPRQDVSLAVGDA